MGFKVSALLGLIAFIAFAMVAPQAQAIIGTASIHAPAVIVENNTGSLTMFNLTVYAGNGSVSVQGPQEVGNSTVQSAVTGAQYASQFLGLNFSKYNFTYTITNGGDNVSGPSGGTAMTLLAISALSGKPLIKNFTVTGTISSNGTVGPIGGVYDKADAAKNGGMNFILVPQAPSGSLYDELYLLVQDTFNIPLIQVSNISTAYKFAFTKTNILANETNVSLYNNLNVGTLPQAPLNCSNACNSVPFGQVANFTLNFTNASINTMAGNPAFNNITTQLRAMLVQDRALVAKGYLYAGANSAFLSYVDSFFFNSYLTNKNLGLNSAVGVQNYCGSISPPQLTTVNYEYVLGGQLRQSWGEYTSNATVSGYNSSIETTDDILFAMRDVATSNGWCNAANFMYNVAANSGGTDVIPSQNLYTIASAKISRASSYGNGMYLSTAEQAFSVNNYPLAIIDADYEYALSNATIQSQLYGTGELINMSTSIAANSTYGIWATQFANEALFYANQATLSTNLSQAHNYATSAYSSALLAQQMSADMQTIYQNLVPGTGTQKINNGENSTSNQSTNTNSTNTSIGYIVQMTHQIFIIAVVMLVVNVVLFFIILYLLLPATKASKNQLNAKKRK